MAIQNWSDKIVVADLSEDPLFTDELSSLTDNIENKPSHAILNLAAVGFINSSNIAKLLRLRKQVLSQKCRLVLCGVNSSVYGVLVVTGLEKIFEFVGDVSTALATVQLGLPVATKH
jgi:anti-anti-sigma factor